MIWDMTLAFSAGYNYKVARDKEEEVKQGKDFYQSSFCQIAEISSLSNIINTFSNEIPLSAISVPLKIGNTVIPLLSLVACPTSAVVKQGHYETAVKVVNTVTEKRFKVLNNRLPQTLSAGAIRAFSFLAEHSGDIATAGMITGATVLTLMGTPLVAGAMLTPLAYTEADTRGYVPRKVSLFMETYLPYLTNMGLMAGGGPVTQALSGLSLATMFPQANKVVHQQLDGWICNVGKLEGPTLKEVDSPLIIRKELSLSEVNSILDGSVSDYEVNPAHCSKDAMGDIPLAEDHQFDKFITLFESIKWQPKYTLLKNSFRDDDRFMDMLRDHFPGKKDLFENFDAYVQTLADNEKKSKEEYLDEQFKKQFQQLIKTLKGEVRVKGSQQDLDEVIQTSAQILAYLNKLDLEKDKIEIEDILKKMTVEGGEYCARGVKRATQEIRNGLTITAVDHDFDPIEEYELKLKRSLQLQRWKILESIYLKIIEGIVKFSKEGRIDTLDYSSETTDEHAVAVAQGVHTIDIYRKAISLGFYPLTDYERANFGLNDLFMWSSPTHPFRQIRKSMNDIYYEKLDDVVKEVGEVHFGCYIRQVILANTKLSPEEQEAVLDKYLYRNNDQWSAEETDCRFHRLMYVMLGILKPTEECLMISGWTDMVFEKEPENIIGEQALKSPIEQLESEEIDISDWIHLMSEAKDDTDDKFQIFLIKTPCDKFALNPFQSDSDA